MTYKQPPSEGDDHLLSGLLRQYFEWQDFRSFPTAHVKTGGGSELLLRAVYQGEEFPQEHAEQEARAWV